MTTQEKTKSKSKSWLSLLGLAAIVLAVYFVNVEVQTYLGKKALANTGLSILTLDQALAAANDQNKNVLVDVSAIWCPTCRKLDREIFSNADVKVAIEKKYVFSRLEYESEEGEKFMETYGVSGFPTLIILDPQGKKLKKLKLTFNPNSFISQL